MDPKVANEHYTAGYEGLLKGNIAFAYDQFSEAAANAPGVPAYRLQLALAALKLARGRDFLLDIAMNNAQMACALDPKTFDHWIYLGEVALSCNRWPEAVAAYEKAISIRPEAFAWGLKAFAHARNGQMDEALTAAQESVRLDPELGTGHFLLSTLYFEKYYDMEKLAYHGEMAFCSKKPCTSQIEAMWNAAHGFLAIGNYKKGWAYWEARLRPNVTNRGYMMPQDRYPTKPMWRGEEIKGKRLLVQHEMGLGDSFCMVRFLPIIEKKYGCEIVFEAQQPMVSLLQHNFPSMKIVPYGQVNPDWVDVQLPAMSMPFILNTKPYTVPNHPYLAAEPEKIAYWKERLDFPQHKLKVGVCWFSGRNSHSADNHFTSKRKSLEFEQFKPVVDVEDVAFVSLQIDRDQDFPNPGIKDFSDTAGIIHNCDLIISVDTAVANLAGAMGKELWLMDRYDYDWRWADIQTPWYPRTGIYRQESPRDWKGVVDAIVRDLPQLRDKLKAA